MEEEKEVIEGEVVNEAPSEPHTETFDDKVREAAERKLRINRITALTSGVYLLLAIATYIILGTLFGNPAWSTAWTLFLGVAVIPTIPEAIMKKRWMIFNFPIFILMIYLTMGMVGNIYGINLWHPYWVLFLLIPVYYSIFGYVDNVNKINRMNKR